MLCDGLYYATVVKRVATGTILTCVRVLPKHVR